MEVSIQFSLVEVISPLDERAVYEYIYLMVTFEGLMEGIYYVTSTSVCT